MKINFLIISLAQTQMQAQAQARVQPVAQISAKVFTQAKAPAGEITWLKICCLLLFVL